MYKPKLPIEKSQERFFKTPYNYLKSEWFFKPDYNFVYHKILEHINWCDVEYIYKNNNQSIITTIRKGEGIISQRAIAKELKIPISKVNYIIKYFESVQCLYSVCTPKLTLISMTYFMDNEPDLDGSLYTKSYKYPLLKEVIKPLDKLDIEVKKEVKKSFESKIEEIVTNKVEKNNIQPLEPKVAFEIFKEEYKLKYKINYSTVKTDLTHLNSLLQLLYQQNILNHTSDHKSFRLWLKSVFNLKYIKVNLTLYQLYYKFNDFQIKLSNHNTRGAPEKYDVDDRSYIADPSTYENLTDGPGIFRNLK